MADRKPSSGDVLRALAEDARERGLHPDRQSVVDAYLDDGNDQDQDQDQGQDDKSEPDVRTTTETTTATSARKGK